LLLAGLGLYGITAYAVSRRRAEIGIRLALGAEPRRVIRLVLSRVAILVGAGVVAARRPASGCRGSSPRSFMASSRVTRRRSPPR
jgi:hypothetical protein